jgi:8-oxo-dGTP pyrophosphatase MutT (NUDIX family)
MRVFDPSVTDPRQPACNGYFWVTLGGKIEEGEDLVTAAHRELFEETGLIGVTVGSPVWYGEQELLWKGELTLLQETFVVARSSDSAIKDAFWTEEERSVIKEVRWWTIDDLERWQNSQERILPAVLPSLIREVAVRAGQRPVLNIDLACA